MIRWTDPSLWSETVSQAVGEASPVGERLVIAPCEGRFRLAASQHYTTEGEYMLEGQVVGHVLSPSGDVVPVHSPFAGWIMGLLVRDGGLVRKSEPVVWLRRL